MLIIWKSVTDNQLISVPTLPGDNHRKIRDRLPSHGWHGEPYFVSTEDEIEKAIAQYKEFSRQNPEWELPAEPIPKGMSRTAGMGDG